MRLGAQRRAAIAALGLLATAGLAGCTTLETACPAIGWFNSVDVEFEGAADVIATIDVIEICGDGQCFEAPRPTAVQTPDPNATGPWYGPTLELSPTRWSVSIDMVTPEEVTITVFDVTGTPLGTATEAVTWTEIDGPTQCGGPSNAGPVTLDVGT